MTEDDARSWIASNWGEQAVARLQALADIVVAENVEQNLISSASIPMMWVRHIADSAQLLPLVPAVQGLWIDVGSGGGFPGLVVAILRNQPIMLVEPRTLRAQFLGKAIATLDLPHAAVQATSIEGVTEIAAILSARAVAPPTKVFELTRGVRDADTVVLLPSGRNATTVLQRAKRTWRGVFHVEQSVTDLESGIIVGREITRK